MILYYVYSERCYSILLGVGRHKFDSSVDDNKIKPNNNTEKKVTVRTQSRECVGNFYKYSVLTNNVFCKCSIVSYRFSPLSLLFFFAPAAETFPPFLSSKTSVFQLQ